MAATTLRQIEEEARQLRALLEATGMDGFREVRLEPGAKPRVRAFWEALGYAPAFDELDLAPPELDAGEQRARAWLADARLRSLAARLPAHFRLVHMDNAGVGFLIADETSSRAREPALLAVLAERRGEIVRERGSYLRYVTEALLERWVLRRGLSASLSVEPAAALEGERMLPHLAPRLKAAHGLLWYGGRLLSPSFDALYETLRAIPAERLSLDHAGDPVVLFDQTESVLKRLRRRRDFLPTTGGDHTHLGTFAGHRVLAASEGRRISLYGADKHALYRTVHGLSTSGPWHVPGCSYASRPFTALPKRSPAKGFERDVGALARFASSLRPPEGKRAKVPSGLPSRVARLAQVLAADPRLARLVPASAKATREQLRVTIGRWLAEGRVNEDGWLVGVRSIDEALRRLPRGGRLLPMPEGAIRSPYGTLFLIDEASGEDDPVVVQLVSQSSCFCIGDHRATHAMARWALHVLFGQLLELQCAWPDGGRALFPHLCSEVRELGPGIFHVEGRTYALDAECYATFLSAASDEMLGYFGPPKAFDHTPLRRPPSMKKLEAAGFRTVVNRQLARFYGDRGTMSIGRIGGQLAFVERVAVGPKPSVTLHCAAEHTKSARAWLSAHAS